MKIRTEKSEDGSFVLNSEFAELLSYNGICDAETLWCINSDPVKNVRKDRATERLYLEPVSGTDFVEAYIKRIVHPGFHDKIKNSLSVKQRYFDAFHEWQAILKFHEKGIPTMTPIAVASCAGGTCSLTLGIRDYIRASDFFERLPRSPLVKTRKRRVISQIAEIAGKMHTANMAHQDFYLVHFFIKDCEGDKVYIIDLQRVVMEETLRVRWRIKDLGQLLFSAASYVSRKDMMFFWKKYCKICGSEFFKEKRLIKGIFRKAEKIRRHNR